MKQYVCHLHMIVYVKKLLRHIDTHKDKGASELGSILDSLKQSQKLNK